MLIEEMRTGNKPKFVVQFKLRCFNPESRVHILLSYLPELRGLTFQQILDDEEFIELENMMHSIGVEFRQLVKMPYVEEEPKPEQDPLEVLEEMDQDEDAIFGRLFDELLNIREEIREVYDSDIDKDEKKMVINSKARDFARLGDAFRRHIRGDLDSLDKTDSA